MVRETDGLPDEGRCAAVVSTCRPQAAPAALWKERSYQKKGVLQHFHGIMLRISPWQSIYTIDGYGKMDFAYIVNILLRRIGD